MFSGALLEGTANKACPPVRHTICSPRKNYFYNGIFLLSPLTCALVNLNYSQSQGRSQGRVKEKERKKRKKKKGRQKKRNLKDGLRKPRPRPCLGFYNCNRLRVRVSYETHSSDRLRARVPA